MMKITFDSKNKTPQPWTVVLCRRNYTKLGILHNITDLRGSFNLNEPQEISFTLHRELNGVKEQLWEEVYNLRVIWIKELDQYFQVEVATTNSKLDNIKDITATSLCEAELSQIMLYNIEINTEEDVENFTKNHPEMSTEEVEKARQIKFWNKEYPENSLLSIILKDKAPHYTVKHVDESLAELQRTFSISDVSIYDWLVGECSEQFDCIFEFDSRDRSISVYDLYSSCENDSCSYYTENKKRYRGEFLDFCPICGSKRIRSYGENTNIVVDKNNLTEEIQLTTDVEAIKNTFRLVAGDDYMTDTVRAVNPNGSEYLYFFSDEMYHDMSDELVAKLKAYDALQESYKDQYEDIMENLYNATDVSAFLEHYMMPGDNSELIREYQKIYDYGLDAYANDIMHQKMPTKYGNVDMNNRYIITWTQDEKNKFANALRSWDYDPDLGSIDTVFGGSSSFDVNGEEVEIAYTPILNTPDEAVFLSNYIVDAYITQLIDKVLSEGDWSVEKFLKYDETGLMISGTNVYRLIAGVGDGTQDGNNGLDAITVGSLLHFVGKYGAIRLALTDTEVYSYTTDTEVEKLNSANIDTVYVDVIDHSHVDMEGNVVKVPTKRTVENAILNYAKVFVRSGYFKLEMVSSTYSEPNPSNCVWSGTIKIINNSDENDYRISNLMTINIKSKHDNLTAYSDFINQKCDMIISDQYKREKNPTVFQMLDLDMSYDKFVEYADEYCLVRLQSFYDAFQECLIAMTLDGIAGASMKEKDPTEPVTNPNRDYDIEEEYDLSKLTPEQKQAYKTIYYPMWRKAYYLEKELIPKRQSDVDFWNEKIKEYEAQKLEIQEILNFKNFLGDLYSEFCSFRREDTYQNDNYISDLYRELNDNAGLFDNARQFIKEANKQIVTSAVYQHSISTNLYNLLLMDEFAPLTDNFELGNYIRVRIEDDIYRLRLIHYEIDFSNLSTLNTEFSDMTKTGNSLNDVRSILDSARQMATSYGYIQKQAEKGNVSYSTLEEFRREGLNSALYTINNNNNEEITYNEHGLMAKSWDDITESYLDKQLRITHNILAFTKDNWKSVSLALGNFQYIDENGKPREGYGLNADFCIASFIQGSTIVGGNIYSGERVNGQHVTHIDLDNGNINIGPDDFVYKNGSLTIRNGAIIGGSFKTSNNSFIVNSDGTFSFANGDMVFENDTLTFSPNVTLTWGQVTGAEEAVGEIATKKATTITNNAISTMEISADKITAGTFRSGVIYGGAISADQITSGDISADRIEGGSLSGVDLTIGGTYSWGSGGRQIPMFYVNSNGTTIINKIITDRISLTNVGTKSVEIYNSGYEHIFGVMHIDGSTAVSGRITTELMCTMGNYFNKLKNDGSGTYEDDPVYEPQRDYYSIIGFGEVYIGSGYSPGLYSDGYGEIGNLRDVKYLVETYSDKRVKENINTLSDITNNYMKLSPAKFNFIENASIKKDWDIEYGLIAQDVEEIFPDLIGKSKPLTSVQNELCGEYIYSLNYNGLHALHIKMIQKHQHEIESLKEEIKQLKEIIKNK